MFLIWEDGEMIGQCWNCTGENFVVVDFGRYVEAICAPCNEPQSVKVAA
jgi:hypothetical protein